MDGTRHGGTAVKQQCQASGSYGTSMPHDCTDINFCVGDPCSANGLCNDTGAHATTQRSGSPFFGDAPVKCACVEDFTLSGLAGAETEFSIAWLEDKFAPHGSIGTFAEAAICRRVTCSSHPAGLDAEADVPESKELFFGEKVTFTCRGGFLTDGSRAEAKRAFTADCSSDGQVTGLQTCEPSFCDYAVPEGIGKHADVIEVGENLRSGAASTSRSRSTGPSWRGSAPPSSGSPASTRRNQKASPL